MAGLLEILVDQGGRADLHVLADELSLEVDALLPIVDTAALLGLLKVEEGDTIITPEGLAFAKADIQERKAIFRKAALANVPLLRQIVSLVSLSRWCNWPLPLPRPRCSRSSFFS
jgi:NitT/TauT family transport system ATP-binding protein